MEELLDKNKPAEAEPTRKNKRREETSENLELTKLNWKNGLTVFEAKMSFLIIGAVITLLFALIMYYFREDISANLTTIVTTFILVIAGVTTAEQALGFFKNIDISGGKGK